LRLIEQEGAVYKPGVTAKNGARVYSDQFQILMQDTIARCGVPLEKIPDVVGNILMAYLGPDVINSEVFDKLVPCPSTCSRMLDQLGETLTAQSKMLLEQHGGDPLLRIVSSTLVMDMAQQGKHHLVSKILVYRRANGTVGHISLWFDRAQSIAADMSVERLTDRLIDQLGEHSLPLIHSATTDGMFAAISEAIRFMRNCDQAAIKYNALSPGRYVEFSTPVRAKQKQKHDNYLPKIIVLTTMCS
jgi:hypothetical protein